MKGEVPPPPAALNPPRCAAPWLSWWTTRIGRREHTAGPQGAIRNFLDEQMRPGDLVAIVRTGAGMGALQQFTTDKRLLYAALDRVNYGREPRRGEQLRAVGIGMARRRRGLDQINRARQEYLAVGSLGAIRFVVNSMRGLPGRKSLVLFTEDMRVMYQGTTDEQVEAEPFSSSTTPPAAPRW